MRPILPKTIRPLHRRPCRSEPSSGPTISLRWCRRRREKDFLPVDLIANRISGKAVDDKSVLAELDELPVLVIAALKRGRAAGGECQREQQRARGKCGLETRCMGPLTWPCETRPIGVIGETAGERQLADLDKGAASLL